jgi:methanogenic corrinoid protein MtbC1
MKRLLTPKQVARAMNVSESSVKRWCDRGLIPTQYTAGGHRRIALGCLLEFLRESKHELVEPDVVGLPAVSGHTHRVVDRAEKQFVEALVAGDESRARQIVFDLYLAGHELAAIFDHIIAPAFAEVGQQWECGSVEVYQERLGCGIAMHVLHELRAMLPRVPDDAPIAVGGAVEGDLYSLGTTMVEVLLRRAGWSATSLGSNLPFATLASALETHRPALFWLSVSHITDRDAFLAGYRELYDAYGAQSAFVVGGRALDETIRAHMRFAAYCDTMEHLEAVASKLRPSASA